jgi:hypothetical protein
MSHHPDPLCSVEMPELSFPAGRPTAPEALDDILVRIADAYVNERPAAVDTYRELELLLNDDAELPPLRRPSWPPPCSTC